MKSFLMKPSPDSRPRDAFQAGLLAQVFLQFRQRPGCEGKSEILELGGGGFDDFGIDVLSVNARAAWSRPIRKSRYQTSKSVWSKYGHSCSEAQPIH